MNEGYDTLIWHPFLRRFCRRRSTTFERNKFQRVSLFLLKKLFYSVGKYYYYWNISYSFVGQREFVSYFNNNHSNNGDGVAGGAGGAAGGLSDIIITCTWRIQYFYLKKYNQKQRKQSNLRKNSRTKRTTTINESIRTNDNIFINSF